MISPSQILTVEPAGPVDKAFVLSQGAAAFALYGDYKQTLGQLWRTRSTAVAWRGGIRQGFVIYERGHAIEVLAIAVATAARRVGVGGRLLGLALEGADTAIAQIADTNRDGQALFRRAGFVPFGAPLRYPDGAAGSRWRWAAALAPDDSKDSRPDNTLECK